MAGTGSSRGSVQLSGAPRARIVQNLHAGAIVKLHLTVDSKPLSVDIDDIAAALLAVRLNLPGGADHRRAISRYLEENGSPWILDENHMRRRILRRVILDIADPALVIRHLMADDEPCTQTA